MIRRIVVLRMMLGYLGCLAMAWLLVGAVRAEQGATGTPANSGITEKDLATLKELFKGEVDLYLDANVAAGDRTPAGRISGVHILGIREFAGRKFLLVSQPHPDKALLARVAANSPEGTRLKNLKDSQW